MAPLRESATSSVALAGLGNSNGSALAHLPLPAEAHDQALALTSNTQRLFVAGRLDEAFKAGRQALACWHALRAHPQSCDVLHLMAWSCLEHEQGVEALALARHALRLAKVHSLSEGLVKALSVLAVLHGRLHDTAVGEQLAMQALSRARDLHDRPMLSVALDALLQVLLDAHQTQRAANDLESARATAERLSRHSGQAMAHSSPRPPSHQDMQLRVDGAVSMAACGRTPEALSALADCVEYARHDGYRGIMLWSQLHGAQTSMSVGQYEAARVSMAELMPQLGADEPPRLRLASMQLQQRLAEHAGDIDTANTMGQRSDMLQKSLMRQRFKLRKTLRRSGDDVMRLLSNLDECWHVPAAKAQPAGE